MTSRALLTARNFTKVNFRCLRIICSIWLLNVKHTNTKFLHSELVENTNFYDRANHIINASLVAPSLSKLQVLGFLVLMDQMLNPWLQVPNRGKALAGWTRPSIDELGVPTEAWSKVKSNILIFFRRWFSLEWCYDASSCFERGFLFSQFF